jgi:hypothetical protein
MTQEKSPKKPKAEIFANLYKISAKKSEIDLFKIP